jgi:OOP family OmpA-OmpF porin
MAEEAMQEVGKGGRAEPDNRGYYGGVSIGSASITILLDDGSTITNQDIEDDGNPISLFIGHRINDYLAIEGGYIDFGEYTSSGVSIGGGIWAPGPVSITIDGYGLYANIVGFINISPGLDLIGKLGMYNMESDAVFTGTVGGTNSASDDQIAPLIGAGLSYQFSHFVTGRLEWTRFNDFKAALAEDDFDVTAVSLLFKF